MAEFKDRLNEAMWIRHISAAELSRISEVNEGAISQYRAGKYKASQRSLDKLAHALNVSIPWLMGADVPMEIDYKRTNPQGIDDSKDFNNESDRQYCKEYYILDREAKKMSPENLRRFLDKAKEMFGKEFDDT